MSESRTGEPPPGYIIVFDKPLTWRGTQAWDGQNIERVVRKVVSIRKRLKDGTVVVRYLTEFNKVLNIKDMHKRSYRMF